MKINLDDFEEFDNHVFSLVASDNYNYDGRPLAIYSSRKELKKGIEYWRKQHKVMYWQYYELNSNIGADYWNWV